MGAGRPTALYSQTVHSRCPRNDDPESCLASKGCRGPGTHANCPTQLWNNRTNWCVNANAPCYACTEPTFPGASSLYAVMYNPHGSTNLNCASCHDDIPAVGGGTTGGGSFPANPHGYTTNNCLSCHNTVPNYTPPGGGTTAGGGTTGGSSFPANPHGYTTNNCLSCHNTVPNYTPPSGGGRVV